MCCICSFLLRPLYTLPIRQSVCLSLYMCECSKFVSSICCLFLVAQQRDIFIFIFPCFSCFVWLLLLLLFHQISVVCLVLLLLFLLVIRPSIVVGVVDYIFKFKVRQNFVLGFYIHTYILTTSNTYKATRQSASHPTAIILPASQSVSQPTKTTSQSIWTNTIKQQTHAPKPLPSLLLRPAILI